MDYFIDGLSEFANFKSRARRKDFWMFHLWCVIVGVFVGVTAGLTMGPKNAAFIANVYNVGLILPSLAITVRRLHDVNKSGWFMFVPFYGFYLMFVEGDKGDNRFGTDPKAPLDMTHMSKAG